MAQGYIFIAVIIFHIVIFFNKSFFYIIPGFGGFIFPLNEKKSQHKV